MRGSLRPWGDPLVGSTVPCYRSCDQHVRLWCWTRDGGVKVGGQWDNDKVDDLVSTSLCPVDSKTISQTGSNTIWLVPRLGRCTYVEGKPQERGILMTLTRVFPPVQADLHNLLGNGSFSGDHGSPEAGNLSPTRIEIKISHLPGLRSQLLRPTGTAQATRSPRPLVLQELG